MSRLKIAVSLACLFGIVGLASAEEAKGTVVQVYPKTNKITLNVSGKTTTYTVGKDASFVSVSTQMAGGKKKKAPTENVTPIEGGLAGIKIGSTATVMTDKVDNKEVVMSVKIAANPNAAQPVKKKNAKKKNKVNN